MIITWTCVEDRKKEAKIHETLVKLGFLQRYTYSHANPATTITVKDCTDREAIRLFSLCMELKQQGLITEFKCEWKKAEE